MRNLSPRQKIKYVLHLKHEELLVIISRVLIVFLTAGLFLFSRPAASLADFPTPTTVDKNAGDNSVLPNRKIRPISLEECLNIARENSEQLENVQSSLQIAELSYEDVKKIYWPKVSVGLNYVIDDARGIDFESDRYQGFIELKQAPFNTGETADQVRSAVINLSAAKLASQKTKRALAVSVAEKYFALHMAKKQLELEKAQVENSQRELARDKVRYQDGLIAEIDLLQAETNLLSKELNLYKIKSTYENTAIALAVLIGLPMDSRLETIDMEPSEFFQIEWVKCREISMQNNVELKIHQEALEKMKEFNKKAKWSRWPSLSVGAFVGSNPPHPYDEDAEVGLSFTVSQKLFDAGVTSRRIKRSLLEIKKQETFIIAFEQKFLSRLKLLYDSLNNNKENVLNAERKKRLALRLSKLTHRSYELGVTSLKEKLDSEKQATQAKIEYIEALAKYRIAEFRLKVEMGIDPLEKDKEIPNNQRLDPS